MTTKTTTRKKAPAKKKVPVRKKHAGGRPRIEIDWKLIEGLCEIQCTQSEIASVAGISVDTLVRSCPVDQNVSFAEFYKIYSENGKSSLRRAQFKKAMSGSVPMLIWMGKQLLGQRDKSDIDMTRKHTIHDFTDDELEIIARGENGDSDGIAPEAPEGSRTVN